MDVGCVMLVFRRSLVWGWRNVLFVLSGFYCSKEVLSEGISALSWNYIPNSTAPYQFHTTLFLSRALRPLLASVLGYLQG